MPSGGRTSHTDPTRNEGSQAREPDAEPPGVESPLATALGQGGAKDGASGFERQARLIQTGRSSPASGARLGSIAHELQQTYGNQYVQRLVAQGDAASVARPVQAARREDERGDDYAVSPETAARIDAERALGRPLEAATRGEMEASLGGDLGDVRVHEGPEAQHLSSEVHAKAFTSGSDVFLGAAAEGPMARQVLAHELTHVADGRQTPGAVQRYDPETEDQMQDVSRSGGLADNGGTTGYEEPPQDDEDGGTTGGVSAPPDDEYTDMLSQRDLDDEQLVEQIDAGQKSLVQYVDGTDLSDEERLRMLGVAVEQRSRPAIVSIWSSFDDLEGTAAVNTDLWVSSAGVTTEVFNLPGMSEIRERFKADVTRIRDTSLQKSGETANQEWERYGISGDREGNPDVAVEQQEQLQNLQVAATLVAGALEAQEEMLKVPIAYRKATPGLEEEGSVDRGDGEPDDFDPAVGFEEPPDIPILFDPLVEIDTADSEYSPAEATWFELNDLYESSAEIIAYWSEQYPALYAVIKDGMGSAGMMDNLGMYADQQQALKTLEAALLDVLIDIHLTEAANINPLDLKAIHDRLYAGGHGLTTSKPWENPFYASIGKQLVQGHENTDWWTAAGVTLFAATVIVTFAFPGAFLALALIGGTSAAVGVAEATVRFEKADELARASDASMRREWELVHKDQSQVEETKAKIALIFSALDVIGLGRDLRAMSAAGAAMDVSDDALKAGALAGDAGAATAEGQAKVADEIVDESGAAKSGDEATETNGPGKAEDEFPEVPGSTGGKAPPGTGYDLTFYQIVERMEAHVNAENIGLQEALKVGDTEYLELIGMKPGQIAVLLNPSHPFFAAQYGNAMESAVAGAFKADSDLAEMIIDARRVSGAIFPPGRRPDFGFGKGPAQGHIVDLTTPKEAAKKAPKYHDRVIVLTYTRP